MISHKDDVGNQLKWLISHNDDGNKFIPFPLSIVITVMKSEVVTKSEVLTLHKSFSTGAHDRLNRKMYFFTPRVPREIHLHDSPVVDLESDFTSKGQRNTQAPTLIPKVTVSMPQTAPRNFNSFSQYAGNVQLGRL